MLTPELLAQIRDRARDCSQDAASSHVDKVSSNAHAAVDGSQVPTTSPSYIEVDSSYVEHLPVGTGKYCWTCVAYLSRKAGEKPPVGTPTITYARLVQYAQQWVAQMPTKSAPPMIQKYMEEARFDFSINQGELHVEIGTSMTLHDIAAGVVRITSIEVGTSKEAAMRGMKYSGNPQQTYFRPKYIPTSSGSRKSNYNPQTLTGNSAAPATSFAAATGQFGAVATQAVAAAAINDAVKAMRTIPHDLGTDQVKQLSEWFQTSVMCTKTDTSLNGHKILAAGKHLIREDHDRKVNWENNVVIYGATYSDVKRHIKQPNVKFYIYDFNDKDKLRSHNMFAAAITSMTSSAGVSSFSSSHSELARRYVTLEGRPDAVLSGDDDCHCSHLVFADCAYEFGPETFTRIIQKSGCDTYSGYMMLPYELLEKFSWYQAEYYRLSVEEGFVLFDPADGENGYVQPLEGYMKFLDSPVIDSRACQMSLVTQLTSAGPFTYFQGYVVSNPSPVIRTLSIPASERCYSVLDLYSAYAANNEMLNLSQLTRINVRYSDLEPVLRYVTTIADKDLTQEFVSQVYKRLLSGTKMMQTYVNQTGHINSMDAVSVSLTILCYELRRRKIASRVSRIDLTERLTFLDSWIARFFDFSNGWGPISEFINRCFPLVGEGQYILLLEYELPQAATPLYARTGQTTWTVPSTDNDDCDFCSLDHGRQEVICDYKPVSDITVSFTQVDREFLTAHYVAQKAVAGSLSEIASKCLDRIPIVDVHHKLRLESVQAPFGTGKTRYMCKFIDHRTACLGYMDCMSMVPFHKLLSGMKAFEQGNRLYNVHTPDVALSKATACKVLLLDEGEAQDAHRVRMLVALTRPDRLIVVGDKHQPTLEPKLGHSIYKAGFADWDSVSRHTFCVNFRNGPQVIAAIKAAHPQHYPYLKCDPLRDRNEKSFEIITNGSRHSFSNFKVLEMTHSQAQAAELNCYTTTQAIGSEDDYAVLHWTRPNAGMCASDDGAHNIVGLTRAKKKTFIFLDQDCPQMVTSLARYGLSVDAPNHFMGNMELAFSSDYGGRVPRISTQKTLAPSRLGRGLTELDAEELHQIALSPMSEIYQPNSLTKTFVHGQVMQWTGKSPRLKFRCEQPFYNASYSLILYYGGAPGHRLLELRESLSEDVVVVVVDPSPCSGPEWEVITDSQKLTKAVHVHLQKGSGQRFIHHKTEGDSLLTRALQRTCQVLKRKMSVICDIRTPDSVAGRNFNVFSGDIVKVFDFAYMLALTMRHEYSLIKFTPVYGESTLSVQIRSPLIQRHVAESIALGFDPFQALKGTGFSTYGLRFLHLAGLKYQGVEMRAEVIPDKTPVPYSWRHLYGAALAFYFNRQLHRPAHSCCIDCDEVSCFEHGSTTLWRGDAHPDHIVCPTLVNSARLDSWFVDYFPHSHRSINKGIIPACEKMGISLVCVCGVHLTTHRVNSIAVGSHNKRLVIVRTLTSMIAPDEAAPETHTDATDPHCERPTPSKPMSLPVLGPRQNFVSSFTIVDPCPVAKTHGFHMGPCKVPPSFFSGENQKAFVEAYCLGPSYAASFCSRLCSDSQFTTRDISTLVSKDGTRNTTSLNAALEYLMDGVYVRVTDKRELIDKLTRYVNWLFKWKKISAWCDREMSGVDDLTDLIQSQFDSALKMINEYENTENYHALTSSGHLASALVSPSDPPTVGRLSLSKNRPEPPMDDACPPLSSGFSFGSHPDFQDQCLIPYLPTKIIFTLPQEIPSAPPLEESQIFDELEEGEGLPGFDDAPVLNNSLTAIYKTFPVPPDDSGLDVKPVRSVTFGATSFRPAPTYDRYPFNRWMDGHLKRMWLTHGPDVEIVQRSGTIRTPSVSFQHWTAHHMQYDRSTEAVPAPRPCLRCEAHVESLEDFYCKTCESNTCVDCDAKDEWCHHIQHFVPSWRGVVVVDRADDCWKAVCHYLNRNPTNVFSEIVGSGPWIHNNVLYGRVISGSLVPCLTESHVTLVCVIHNYRGAIPQPRRDPPSVVVAGRFAKLYNQIIDSHTKPAYKHAFVMPPSLYKLETEMWWNQPSNIMLERDDREFVLAETQPSSSTALRLSDSLCGVLAQITEQPFNTSNSAEINMEFRDARVSLSFNEIKLNSRGHPRDPWVVRNSMANVYGNVFNAKNPMEIAKVLSKRYNCRSMPTKVFTASHRLEIDNMLDAHFIKYLDPVPTLDDETIDLIFHNFTLDARDRAYDKRFVGEGWDYREDIASVRFSLKSCDKVANMTKGYNPDAVAQGIAASSLGFNAKVHLITRVMATVRRLSHKKTDNVYGATMHGQSQEEFILELSKAFSAIEYTQPSVANSDIGKADSGYLEAMVYHNKGYWKRQGFSHDVIDYLYAGRTNLDVFADGISCTTRCEVTSGHLLTKEEHEVVQEVIGNYVLDGSGPLVWASSGDDFLKQQGGLHLNERRLRQTSAWYNFEFTFIVNDCFDFCGMLVDRDGMGLNLAMKTLRVLSRSAKNIEDLAEYQTSLKEYLYLVAKIGANKCISMTTRNYASYIDQMCDDEAEACYQFLIAYANADPIDLFNSFEVRKYLPAQQEGEMVTGYELALDPKNIQYKDFA